MYRGAPKGTPMHPYWAPKGTLGKFLPVVRLQCGPEHAHVCVCARACSKRSKCELLKSKKIRRLRAGGAGEWTGGRGLTRARHAADPRPTWTHVYKDGVSENHLANAR